MTIINETKLVHEILGEICFDDGIGDSRIGIQDRTPFWLARPMGWLSDGVEILLSGDFLQPATDSLGRAIQVFKSLGNIEKEGQDLIHPIIMNTSSPERHATQDKAILSWIGCQQENSIAVFTWDGLPYVRWDATLNEENRIVELQQTTW